MRCLTAGEVWGAGRGRLVSPRLRARSRVAASPGRASEKGGEKEMSDTILISYLSLLGACDFVEGEFEGMSTF